MNYPTLATVDLSGKRVLLRAGFDVPMENGIVNDTTRIEAMVPTMRHILDHGASLIIMAHQGRPKGIDLAFSQKVLVPVLEQLLSARVSFADSCTGPVTLEQAKSLQPGDVLLLENLRFVEGETSKDAAVRDAFAKELAALADIYVDDAFTNAHRDHASMTGVPKYLPGYLGLQIQKEVEGLGKAVNAPKKPVTLIISGSKIETKVPVIERFLETGDNILVGGCIANTLLAASGTNVCKSKYDTEFVELAQGLLSKNRSKIHLPTDAVVAASFDAEARVTSVDAIAEGEAIFDIGPATAESYADIIAESGTVVWNGPLGVYEKEHFAGSSKRIAEALRSAVSKGTVVVIGGGDTLDFHDRYGISMNDYTFASTAGGAMLDYISGKAMPALEALVR